MPIDVDSWMRVAFVVQLLSMGIVRAMYAGATLGEKKGRRFRERPVVAVGMVVGGIAFYVILFAYLFSRDPSWLDIGLSRQAKPGKGESRHEWVKPFTGIQLVEVQPG